MATTNPDPENAGRPGSESERAEASRSAAAGIDRSAYPFRDRYAALPAGRMHYVDEGDNGGGGGSIGGSINPIDPIDSGSSHRDTLLFVHGTPTWSFDWRRLIASFSDRYRCVAPDLLGFGLSERPPDFAYTPEAHAGSLADFVRELGLKDVTLIVHDFGGPIGLPLLLEQSGMVKRVVLINTWMWGFAGDKAMKAMERSARMAGGAVGRFLYRRANFSLKVLTPYAYGDRKKLTPALHKQYLDRFPDAWSRERVLWALARSLLASGPFFASLWEKRDRLRSVPVLILWGMKDRAFPPALLRRWKEALPGAKTVELADAGHWPHEEAPAEVESALRAFLGGG